MAIRLNHTIVAARDKDISAMFLTMILGPPSPSLIGPFAVVRVSDDTSLDYIETDGEITSQHYALLMDENEAKLFAEPSTIFSPIVRKERDELRLSFMP
jgi:hypothetical protein